MDRTPVDSTEPRSPSAARRRRRALAWVGVLALALHAAFLAELGGETTGAPDTASAAPAMAVRAIAADPVPAPVGAQQAVVAAVASPVAEAPAPPPPKTRSARASREPMRAPAEAIEPDPKASTGSPFEPSVVSATAEPGATIEASPPAIVTTPDPPARAPELIETTALAAAGAANPDVPALPGLGDQPPPLYRTQLPPAATLRYEVRRGILRGEGEIRWQPARGDYRLVLEARIAGLTLLVQTSEGALDANGLAPTRFLDQRGRRAPQAANFVRSAGKVKFSGTSVEWPLVPGSQDRLSWMIQLAGIAAGEPRLLGGGERISMVVVGARGDAAVWTLRVAGPEEVETAHGQVRAVKLVRAARSAYDTSAEIWLDPERSYFPVRATLRNSSGAPEYELLLERIDP